MNNKSKLTAIARKRPSVPMRRLYANNRLGGKNMLDYGCGRGLDAQTYGMAKYDPYHAPELLEGTDRVRTSQFDVITCNYVLNVIPTEKGRQEVLDNIRILLKKTGVAYITVRRDIKTEGYTKRGTYQENINLNLPILWENSNYCTYLLTL